MDIEDKRVTTRKAAEIAGMGYEGFRTCLKRGLLKKTGILIPMVASDAPAPDLDAKRWTWSEFGMADLCAFRLAKVLMDAGISFESANNISSDHRLWEWFRYSGNLDHSDTPSFLIVAGKDIKDYGLYTEADFYKDFLGHISEAKIAILVINIKMLRKRVIKALDAAE